MLESWSPNIVSFKTYNTGNADGLALWEAGRRHPSALLGGDQRGRST